MPYTLLIHLANEDPIVAEVEALPGPQDMSLICHNPRRRDGKDVHYLMSNVTTVIFPMTRVGFIEVLPTGEEEQVFGFVRER